MLQMVRRILTKAEADQRLDQLARQHWAVRDALIQAASQDWLLLFPDEFDAGLADLVQCLDAYRTHGQEYEAARVARWQLDHPEAA